MTLNAACNKDPSLHNSMEWRAHVAIFCREWHRCGHPPRQRDECRTHPRYTTEVGRSLRHAPALEQRLPRQRLLGKTLRDSSGDDPIRPGGAVRSHIFGSHAAAIMYAQNCIPIPVVPRAHSSRTPLPVEVWASASWHMLASFSACVPDPIIVSRTFAPCLCARNQQAKQTQSGDP